MEKHIDTSYLDKAIIFAVNAHQGVERRGKGFPYIVHPLEALSIASSMSNDQEILAAAVLHDVVEDTSISIDTIEKEFGKRVADIVREESDNLNNDEGADWKSRKLSGINRIKNGSREVQIVALSDKLSNMRAIYADYKEIGDNLWNRFHESDPRIHAWRYNELVKAFDKLTNERAYKEFKHLVAKVFNNISGDFATVEENKIIKVFGKINEKNASFLANKIINEGFEVLDFDGVTNIDYSTVRQFYDLSNKHVKYSIRNASNKVMTKFCLSGAYLFVNITNKPREVNILDYEVSGDGYTAVSYNHKHGDTMMKLYAPFIPPEVVEKEKIVAQRVLTLGINTPFSGDLVTCEGKIGIVFERIKEKRSVARAISQEPERLKEFTSLYAKAVKDLHNHQCDTILFSSIKVSLLAELEAAKEHFSQEEYQYIKKFIEENNNQETCTHGDLHIGNVLLTPDNQTLFIDLSDFAYGNPLFDVSMLYVMAYVISEDRCLGLYHITQDQMKEVWNNFVKEYFGVDDNGIEAINDMVKPYAGVRIIQFANRSRWKDGGVANGIKKLIFNK